MREQKEDACQGSLVGGRPWDATEQDLFRCEWDKLADPQNDLYGHAVGDVRAADIPCQMGTELLTLVSNKYQWMMRNQTVSDLRFTEKGTNHKLYSTFRQVDEGMLELNKAVALSTPARFPKVAIGKPKTPQDRPRPTRAHRWRMAPSRQVQVPCLRVSRLSVARVSVLFPKATPPVYQNAPRLYPARNVRGHQTQTRHVVRTRIPSCHQVGMRLGPRQKKPTTLSKPF